MAQSADDLVEHFFRHQSANLVAVLTRAFGFQRIDLIEDAIQVAMLEAMDSWSRGGIPDRPAAWIHRVAKNRIVDGLRRLQVQQQATEAVGRSLADQESMVDRWLEDEQLPDSLLRMIFVCCHPSLDRKTQIALTLNTLCGFGISEVARGLLLAEETAKKRIQRAKRSLADANMPLELPADDQLASRLEVVHDVLYLMFNEGYSTTRGSEPIRDDICEEAVRLCHLLCQSQYSSTATKALLALLLFHSARLNARTDSHGAAVRLEDQDRQKWDQRLIHHAQYWLEKSKTESLSTFHLEAAIAMQHCVASSVDTTDWPLIVRLYDRLRQLRDSPIYQLNQAIAIGQAGNQQEAIAQLNAIRDHREMENYLLLECSLARLHESVGDHKVAIDYLLSAMNKATAGHEKEFIEKELRRLSSELGEHSDS